MKSLNSFWQYTITSKDNEVAYIGSKIILNGLSESEYFLITNITEDYVYWRVNIVQGFREELMQESKTRYSNFNRKFKVL